MKEIIGELWDYKLEDGYVKCITTNGTIKKNGRGVMGRGCALEAKRRCEAQGFDVSKRLAECVKTRGNVVSWLNTGLLSFPTKYNWWENSDLELIKQSAEQLAIIANNFRDKWYVLPRPGCGNGKLKWEDVKPVIENILPDNVLVITHTKDKPKQYKVKVGPYPTQLF